MSVLLLAVAVPLLAALMTAWTHGWTLADVETGSMRPGIRPGSMVVLTPVDVADVEQGTIIGFHDERRGGAVTTHRVVEVLEQKGGRYFRTQGDANTRPDGPIVAASAVVGEVRWRITGLGAIADAATKRSTQVALIAIPIALLVLSELVGVRQRRKADEVGALRAALAQREADHAAALERLGEEHAAAVAALEHQVAVERTRPQGYLAISRDRRHRGVRSRR